MTTRILPREEWAKLAGTEAGEAWPAFPDGSAVIVVERGGEILGCHALLPYWHVECLWIAPGARGRGGVARALWGAVQRTVRAMGISAVLTTAIDDRVRRLLGHVGASKLPGESYVIPMRGK